MSVKLLFDQNLSYRLCHLVAPVFPDAAQVRLLGLDTADDREIWTYARAEELVLVSHDADFAEMAALFGPPPKVVWLRCGNRSTSEIATILMSQGEAIAAFAASSDEACLQVYGAKLTPSR